MAKSKNRGSQQINSGSMADIAFLLLIFFLVTTTIASDKGLPLILPPKPDPNQPPPEIDKNARNIFKILINSRDQMLVEDEYMELSEMYKLKPMIKEFLLNYGRNPQLSDNPEEAVVSLKTDRGTSYEVYIDVYNEILAAYNEIYAERAGITVEQWRNLDLKDPRQKQMYDDARDGFPRNISIAEPNKGG
jgi:biopolymer transport protein ExbD